MSNISSFPTAIPDGDDLILGSQIDVAGTPSTKNFTVQSIVDKVPALSLGYTSLVQLLTQTSTNAPIATEVYNNTGQTYTWTRLSTGLYKITSTGTPFVASKTVVFLNAGSSRLSLPIYWERTSTNTIELYTYSDGGVENAPFEIKIYN
ncbi:hypothetical protein N9Q05_01940 [bacterium]|nr:hypothetical protein [bacterium]